MPNVTSSDPRKKFITACLRALVERHTGHPVGRVTMVFDNRGRNFEGHCHPKGGAARDAHTYAVTLDGELLKWCPESRKLIAVADLEANQ